MTATATAAPPTCWYNIVRVPRDHGLFGPPPRCRRKAAPLHNVLCRQHYRVWRNRATWIEYFAYRQALAVAERRDRRA